MTELCTNSLTPLSHLTNSVSMKITFLVILRCNIHIFKYLKRKLYSCNASIYFNQQCLTKQLVQSYVKVKIPKTSPAYIHRVIPQHAEVAEGVPGRLRPQIFLTFATTRVVGRQPYAPAAYTPGGIPGTHFQRLSRPQGTWFRREPRKKSPVTPPGIDPGTFRLVAQCLYHYAIPGPAYIHTQHKKPTLRIKGVIKYLHSKKKQLNSRIYHLHVTLANTWDKTWPCIQNTIERTLQTEMQIRYKSCWVYDCS